MHLHLHAAQNAALTAQCADAFLLLCRFTSFHEVFAF